VYEKVPPCTRLTHSSPPPPPIFFKKRVSNSTSIVFFLAQSTQPVNWAAAIRAAVEGNDVSHVLDFGPGGTGGAANFTACLAEGTGTQVILASHAHSGDLERKVDRPTVLGMNWVVASEEARGLPRAANWGVDHMPRAVKRTSDQKLLLDTKFSRLIGKPPVLIGGMTPTTSEKGVPLVAAAANAGYHAELAAGGLSRPAMFQAAIDRLVSLQVPGAGVNLNMLYLNAKQWNFQFPMVCKMRAQGTPIVSVTIAAGIPTPDTAKELMEQLLRAGINIVAFKPGSLNAIMQVVEIAKLNPDMNIILQWTGGRAGGHHSFEDMHQPLLEGYGSIRSCDNIVLAVGSGFGDAKDSLVYMTGEWSKKYKRPSMPCDAILIASRVMVAKEAATEDDVKKLIVACAGVVDEKEWEQSYDGVAGGILTVTSELGEPIHKVANRGMQCWLDFDRAYFSLPVADREAAILKDKQKIIQRLNADFQKPYFGKLTDGSVCDLDDMSYLEVATRMVDIMYVNDETPARWLHPTFKTRLYSFLQRTEQRLGGHDSKSAMIEPLVKSASQLSTNPMSVIYDMCKAYPDLSSALIASEDVDFFMELCRTGGKPVNFIPIVDKSFITWFKKDSLWYSEDLAGVPERDADRVCILHGPVAAKYSNIVNEPVKDIMDSIANGHLEHFAKDSSGLPEVSVLSMAPLAADSGTVSSAYLTKEGATLIEFTLPEAGSDSPLPTTEAWFSDLTKGRDDWFAAFLRNHPIVDGKMYAKNPIERLMRPREGQRVEIATASTSAAASTESVKLFKAQADTDCVVQLTMEAATSTICVSMFEDRPATADWPRARVPLEMLYRYSPETAPYSIYQCPGVPERVKDWYSQIWLDASPDVDWQSTKIDDVFHGDFKVTQADIDDYNRAIKTPKKQTAAPLDFATVASWRPLIRSLFPSEIAGDLLQLVHLKHNYRLLGADPSSRRPLADGDLVRTRGKVTSILNVDSGKEITSVAKLSRVGDAAEEEPYCEVASKFLIRGQYNDWENTFTKRQETLTLVVPTDLNLRTLRSKSWFVATAGADVQVGDKLVFQLDVVETHASAKVLSSAKVSGSVTRVKANSSPESIASVAYSDSELFFNPVMEYFERWQDELKASNDDAFNEDQMLEENGYLMLDEPVFVQAPVDATEYAVASRDLNPIHRCTYAAELASLPGGSPIIHGMWSCAFARRVVLENAAHGNPELLTDWGVSFEGMVFPGDELACHMRHVGMSRGKKLVSVEVFNQNGEKVLSGDAKVLQKKTAFVFTGQGSAEPGMGMERYRKSKSAQAVWDTAEEHLKKTFGFSILEITRSNPKTLTVHFGGSKGKLIRENYMNLTVAAPKEDGTTEIVPLIPEIDEQTQSFRFSAPDGLLYATQFSQPALVLVEKAEFTDMQVAGLVPEDSIFAGHSLGEYAALASVANILTIENLVETVFLRGMVMQQAVQRDADGRSDFGMVAANPMRVGGKFNEKMLFELVDAIDKRSGRLVQVVNYNVQNRQYVVAGDLRNLHALGTVMDNVRANPALAEASLDPLIDEAISLSNARKDNAVASGRPFVVPRGSSTIPLPGIDVPFHSRQLLPGVPAFRDVLAPKINEAKVNEMLHILVDRYVPNVVAQPFQLSKEYVTTVYNATMSPILESLLEPENWATATPAKIGHSLVIELLAYQFASPVLWIATQQHLFADRGVMRMIEIGPAPTLTNMGLRTLQSGKFGRAPRDVLWGQRDEDLVLYQLEDCGPSAVEVIEARKIAAKANEISVEMSMDVPESAPAPAAIAPPPAPVQMQMPVAAPAASAAPVEDAPVSASEVLKVLLAVKLKKNLGEVGGDKSIKDLSGGKSAVQNEIVGDLEKEFGGSPDGGAEMPVDALATKFPDYNAIGKVTSGLINKMLSSKMPGGFSASAVRAYLADDWKLGAGRVDSVLLHALTMAPENRLGGEGEAKKWLDGVVNSYAATAGVSISKGGAGGGAPAMGFNPMMMMAMGGGGGGGAPTPVAEASVSPKEALTVLLAVKLKKDLNQVSDSASIKDLSGGKSAVQNEIVGDLEKEFGGSPDGGAEMPLADLASKFDNYSALGKVTTALINKMLSSKMPGGLSASGVKSYLADTFSVGPQRTEGILLHALTHAPEDRFGSDADAKVWLDRVVDSYSKVVGLTITKGGGGGGGGAAMPMMMGMGSSGPSPDFVKQKSQLQQFMDMQLTGAQDFMGIDNHESTRKLAIETALREEVEGQLKVFLNEHGEVYEAGIRPRFDAKKVRIYESFWNWVIVDAMDLHYTTVFQYKAAIQEAIEKAKKAEELKKQEAESFERDAHTSDMATWITSEPEKVETSAPPSSWFRPWLCNRATPELQRACAFYHKQATMQGRDMYAQAVRVLAEEVSAWLERSPVHIELMDPVMPSVNVQDDGKIDYQEIPRTGVTSSLEYVFEMARGLDVPGMEDFADGKKLSSTLNQQTLATFDTSTTVVTKGLVRTDSSGSLASLDSLDSDTSEISTASMPARLKKKGGRHKQQALRAYRRSVHHRRSKMQTLQDANKAAKKKALKLPYVHIRSAADDDPMHRTFDEELSKTYLGCMREIATDGITFEGKCALVTGCGRGSIAIELVKALLEGGASVVVTTSSFSKKTTDFYRTIYENHGSRGAKLTVLPCNQGSQQDIASLVSYVYDTLKLDLDYLIPFAAISEAGIDIGNIGDRSEVAHRIMLTNTVRLLGMIRNEKQLRGVETHPTLCLMPMSPNHGVFGNDGLYAESKLGIESIVNKWNSEGWKDYLSITAAVIGWTRGTGLMAGNNMVAPGVEKLGMRTFSTQEMAFNLLTLLHPEMAAAAQETPIWGDLGGGFGDIKDLKAVTDKIRADINTVAGIQKHIAADKALDDEAKNAKRKAQVHQLPRKALLQRLRCGTFPSVPSKEELQSMPDLQGIMDLEKVVVVVGFGEVGPYGSSRTRWEMESYGEFSMEGCIELAWLVGLIKYHSGPLNSNGKTSVYNGWVDTKTGEKVGDHEVKPKYEEYILEHSGIRLIEPELFEGYNPHQKMVLHQIALEKRMAAIEVADKEEGEEFVTELGAKNCDLFQRRSDGQWMIQLREGAVLSIPKALRFDRFVAGQIPTGWDAVRLGVPKDIAQAVDPVTLFALVSAAEAMVSAGICDPYEFYEYVHLSDVGNAMGGGMGGMRSLKRIYRERALGIPVPNDSLQECFINTMPAWINMLMLSSCGPIKTPVGACATAAESVEIGMETIVSGKARVMLVGGYDDFGEEGSYEFAQMKATSDTNVEVAMGRDPREMCRPCTNTRGGFMEAQGCGVQILMDAALALQMGCPIHAIVALTNTSTDGQGRSVPAPGQGVLSTARESHEGSLSGVNSPFLDVSFRRQQLASELEFATVLKQREVGTIESECASLAGKGGYSEGEIIKYREDRTRVSEQVHEQRVKSAKQMWGNDYFKRHPEIAPLRGALSVWGLGVDDIAVASFHGTGTKANDKNESEVTHKQMQHLGRSRGNPLMVICQKWLTGHPKGAAASWMFNGLLQVLQTGLVPGNRNNDNTCKTLRPYSHLVYPNRAVQTEGVKAAILKSFGFGQAGGEILLVHPERLFAAVSLESLDKYLLKRRSRETKSHQYMQGVFTEKHELIQVKSAPPYNDEDRTSIFLDPTARATYEPSEGSWKIASSVKSRQRSQSVEEDAAAESMFKESQNALPKQHFDLSVPSIEAGSMSMDSASVQIADSMQQAATMLASTGDRGIGIDAEPLSTFQPIGQKKAFVERNFTRAEREYCLSAPDSAASFAGRWAAKEAVVKALCCSNLRSPASWKDSGASLSDIEVGKSRSGAPFVSLHGNAKIVFDSLGLTQIQLSISHTDAVAVAQAVVR
jgi:fatty acid synthase subunit beta